MDFSSPSLLHSTQLHLVTWNQQTLSLSLGFLREGRGRWVASQDWQLRGQSSSCLLHPLLAPSSVHPSVLDCHAGPAELGQVLPPAQQTQAFGRYLYTEKWDLQLTGKQNTGMNCFRQRFALALRGTAAAGACLCTESVQVHLHSGRSTQGKVTPEVKSTVGNIPLI